MSSEVEFEVDRALRRAMLFLCGVAAIFTIEVAVAATLYPPICFVVVVRDLNTSSL
jgi:hypothetical protein